MPLVGLSGRYFDVYTQAANVERADCYITNLVKDFREYAKPTAADIAADHDELVQEIRDCDPEVIGLIGAWAVENVMGKQRADIERTHGVPVHVDALFGGELSRPQGYICLPILHPANVIHQPEMAPQVLDDFLTLGKLLDGEITVRETDPYEGKENYAVQPCDEARIILPAGVDTEGDRARPWCVTYATVPGAAFIAHPPQRAQFADLVWLHNSLHDLGVLRELGIELAEDQFIDTMVLAYHLCIEPQALKSLAYRYCGAERSSYDEMVAPAQEAISLAYLMQVIERSEQWPLPEPEVIYEGGNLRVYKPQSIFRRANKILTDYMEWQTGKREKSVDIRERWRQIDYKLRAPVIAALGDMRHADLSDIEYGKAMTYACHDASDTLRVGPILMEKIKAMELEEAVKVDHDILAMVDRMQTVGIQLAPPSFWDDMEHRCQQQMDKARWQIYQMTSRDLNPASGDQVADLLYGATVDGGLALTPPMLTDGGKTGKRRGSTNDKCLENLLAETSVVQPIMDYREADKIRGTYVEPLREIASTGDGRVRATFRVTRTTSGRLSTAEPNLQSLPIMSELGVRIRYGLIARLGWTLYDADLSQIEMRVMAHESRDERLCQVFYDHRDIHAMSAHVMFGTSIEQVTKWQRNAAKHVNFGIINGTTEHGLVNQMILYRATREDGSRWTLDDCANMIREWFGYYKGVKRFQNACIAETQQTGLTRENISGRIRYLPGVWAPQKVVREEAERCSYVHKVQGGAQALLKRAMKVMWDGLKHLDGVEPLLQVHDEQIWEVRDEESLRELVDLTVIHAMTTTTKLRVPVEADGGFGDSWGSAKQ